eukprot:scaffold575_cov79-Skeletonema_dohrnii-CCMP3373.AAC.1
MCNGCVGGRDFITGADDRTAVFICHRCAEKSYGSFCLCLSLSKIEKLLSDHFIFVFAEGACPAAA